MSRSPRPSTVVDTCYTSEFDVMSANMSTSREPITSPQNPRIKQAIRLRDAKHRRQTGLTLIDGLRELQHAVNAKVSLDTLFFTDPSTLPEGPRKSQITAILQQVPVSIQQLVTPAILEKLGFGDRNEGVVAVASPHNATLDSIELSQSPIVLVLDQLEKPGNLGAVLRSADAAGAAAVILSDSICDPFNPNAIRASQGAIFQVPLISESSSTVQKWLANQKLAIWTARVDGSIPYTQANFERSGAIVLGNEANGLGDNWKDATAQAIRLPMLGAADSLNVSVTAAVILYEALRQRSGENRPAASN